MKLFDFSDSEQNLLREVCETWEYWTFSETKKFLSMNKHHHLGYLELAEKPKWPAILVFSTIVDVSEIFYLYVFPERRNQGYGIGILRDYEEFLKQSYPQIHKSFLEVSENNTHAIELYRKFGMENYGIRHEYYKNGDDAILVKKAIY